MARKRPTVADVRANKGKRQYTMLRVESWEELEAAEKAGIDKCSVPPEMMCDLCFRDIAPGVFAIPGVRFFELGTTDDFIRWAFHMLKHGADAVYCSASFDVVKRLSDEFVPVIGHVGLIPSKCTYTGGFKAVGKTADSAMKTWQTVKKYEEVGAFGAEIDVCRQRSPLKSRSARHYSWFRWAQARAATRNISSLTMCSGRTAAMFRVMPRDNGTSPPSSATTTLNCRRAPIFSIGG
jgi:ketopantoate hydroxymethyltransferase